MNLENSHPSSAFPSELGEAVIVKIQCDDRWQVYFRLQELDVQCWCAAYQPLTVRVDSAIALVQLWSVVKQTEARSQLIDWLEACWCN